MITARSAGPRPGCRSARWRIWRERAPTCRAARATGASVARLAALDGVTPLTTPEVRHLIYRLGLCILAPPEAGCCTGRAGVVCTKHVRCAASPGVADVLTSGNGKTATGGTSLALLAD